MKTPKNYKSSGHLKNYRYKLHEGNEWNPLLRWPRNISCFCGSSIKAKRCCLPKLSLYVNEKDAKKCRALMEANGFV